VPGVSFLDFSIGGQHQNSQQISAFPQLINSLSTYQHPAPNLYPEFAPKNYPPSVPTPPSEIPPPPTQTPHRAESSFKQFTPCKTDKSHRPPKTRFFDFSSHKQLGFISLTHGFKAKDWVFY
jgi:hypothetical protein